jgi:predicted nucleic-acid-binding Zn-ribbon protein
MMKLQAEAIPQLTFIELEEHLRLARVNPGHYEKLLAPLLAERALRSPIPRFKCAKCSHESCFTSEIRGTRSFLSSIFDVQSARYFTVVCARCSFSEFYQSRVSTEAQAIDFLIG